MDQFADQLAALRKMVMGRDPLPRPEIVPIREGVPLMVGSTARPIQVSWRQRPSGLLVPNSLPVEASLLDQIKVYATAEETLGLVPPLELLIKWTQEMSVPDGVIFAAYWMCRLDAINRAQSEVDQEFLGLLADETGRRAANLLRDEKRVIVVYQALVMLLRLTLLYSPTQAAPSDFEPWTRAALLTLAIPSYLDSEQLPDHEDWVVTNVPGPLGRDLIANQVFNSRVDPRISMGVTHRVWRELPRERGQDSRMPVDLAALYEEVVGVSMSDVNLIAWALAAPTVNGGQTTSERSALYNLGVSDQAVDGVLQLLSATPQQLQQMLLDDVEEHPGNWSASVLDQFPVVNWGDHLTVLSTARLFNRVAGKWPLFDVLRELESRGDQERIGHVRNAVAYSFELWVSETLRRIVGDPSRYYDEDALRAAFPRVKICDAALDYGSSWVLFEVTTMGLSRATAAGLSDEAVTKDIEGYVKKARQLHSVIENLRAHEEALTGLQRQPRRFFPAILVESNFPTNPILMTLLWERCEREGLLQGDDVGPLEMLDSSDLVALEFLSSGRGLDLATVFKRKAESNFRGGSVRDFAYGGLGVNPQVTGSMAALFNEWTRSVIERVRVAQEPLAG